MFSPEAQKMMSVSAEKKFFKKKKKKKKKREKKKKITKKKISVLPPLSYHPEGGKFNIRCHSTVV